MPPWARFPGLATNVLKGSADLADTGPVRYLLVTITAFLGACMSTRNAPVMTTLISHPAGATCTTEDGEVFTLPAAVPCHPEGATRFEVTLPGHAPRSVLVTAGVARPSLSSLFLVDMVGGLVGGAAGVEVTVVEGAATIELEPIPAPTVDSGFHVELTSQAAVPPRDEVFDMRSNDGSSIGSLPSPAVFRFW